MVEVSHLEYLYNFRLRCTFNTDVRWGLAWEWKVVSHDGKVIFNG